MLFNSFIYIFAFLPIVVLVYFFLIKKRFIVASKAWLVIASLFFYNWWNPSYTKFLVLSIIFNFSIGYYFCKVKDKTKIQAKILLYIGVISNLLLLGYFKYMDFFIQNINSLFHSSLPLFKIVLPLGISFYTLQQITYLVDSYRNLTKEYNFLSYFLFVSFFPQLIAGPIVHHKEMMPQFESLKTKIINRKNIILGIFLFVIGLFKKSVLADTFSLYVNTGFYSDNLSMLEAWISSLSYTFQIYFDFSGYCDMAMGSALLFNIKLPINFNSPYKAKSIQEFWQKWHITLARFLKDYVYIPLGGSRCSKLKFYRNIIVTFFISGVWHGADWTLILSGTLHGCLICINKLWSYTKITFSKHVNLFITFMTINFICVLVRADNFVQAKKVYSAMFNISNCIIPELHNLTLKFQNMDSLYENVLIFIPLGIFLSLFCINSNEIIAKIKLDTVNKSLMYAAVFSLIFLVCLIKIIVVPYSEFIYFNF